MIMVMIRLCRQFTGVGSSTEKGGRREFKVREAGEQGTGGGWFWPPVPSPHYTISCVQKQFRISRTFTISQQGRHELDLTTTFRQLCRALHDHQGPKSAVFNVQYPRKAMLDYSETSENAYLAFNHNIGLNKKNSKIWFIWPLRPRLCFRTLNFCQSQSIKDRKSCAA